jgi:hypothetical protein
MVENLGYHACASMAVKAVVTEVKKKLATRFNTLPNIPDFFYDMEKGLTDQFKQYYAEIPEEQRANDWIALAYSYDSVNQSTIQPRNGFQFPRPVTNTIKRYIEFQYVELPLLFSVLTNNSKLFNAINSFLLIKTNYSFSCKFQDLLWPEWLPGEQYPLGWYIRPKEPNNYLYMCSKAGLSGETEPIWSTVKDNVQDDNEAQWTCIEPELWTVKAGNFVKNDTAIQNPIENGIMYQLDFGYTLHFTELDDAGELVGTVTKAELNLFELDKNNVFGSLIDTIKIPPNF